MTSDSNRPAFGPSNIDLGAKTDLTPDAGERNGDRGVRSVGTTPVSIDSESDRLERARMHFRWAQGDVQDTDLERRVLAHERILQAFIAHMAEAEPEFIARLRAVFSDPLWASRGEYDYTDTPTYADRFVEEIVCLMERRRARGAAREPMPPRRDVEEGRDVVMVPDGRVVTLLKVSQHRGIWEVTKDGSFYGHYTADQPAFDAAEAAAFAIVANGGAADVLWNDARPQQAKDLEVGPIGVVHTMEFRAGSARIVR